MKMKKIDELMQEISPFTLAIIPEHDEYGNPGSWIIDKQEEYYIQGVSPSTMIDYACQFFGATLRGRQEATRMICNIVHKSPISINPTSGMYFFPTISPSHPDCAWIAHSHIQKVKPAEGKGSEIIFTNGRSLILKISLGTLLNQVQRTAQFRYLLDSRIKGDNRQKVEIVTEY